MRYENGSQPAHKFSNKHPLPPPSPTCSPSHCSIKLNKCVIKLYFGSLNLWPSSRLSSCNTGLQQERRDGHYAVLLLPRQSRAPYMEHTVHKRTPPPSAIPASAATRFDRPPVQIVRRVACGRPPLDFKSTLMSPTLQTDSRTPPIPAPRHTPPHPPQMAAGSRVPVPLPHVGPNT